MVRIIQIGIIWLVVGSVCICAAGQRSTQNVCETALLIHQGNEMTMLLLCPTEDTPPKRRNGAGHTGQVQD